MITLTEKRLQELEHKHSTYLAEIERLQKKLSEVNTFPKEIESIRKQYQDLSKAIKDHIDEFRKSSSDLSYLHNLNHKSVEEHSKTLKNNQNSIDSINSTVSTQTNQINTLQRQLETLTNESKISNGKLNSRIEDSHKVLSENANALNNLVSVSKKHEIYIEKSKELFEKTYQMTQKLENQLLSLKSDLEKSNSWNTARNLEIEKKINSKPSEMPKLKNYDQDIVDIRKDIASLVSSIAANQPDLTPINAKIKTMENSIAQIYALLKKYEGK